MGKTAILSIQETTNALELGLIIVRSHAYFLNGRNVSEPEHGAYLNFLVTMHVFIPACSFYFTLHVHAEGCGEVHAVDSNGEEEVFSVKLGDVLAFATGADTVPPIGYNTSPAIQFHDASQYPVANTCSNILKLPMLVKSFQEFEYNFCFGMCNAVGFGHV